MGIKDMKKILALNIGIFVLCLLVLMQFSVTEKQEATFPIQRIVQYSFQLENKSNAAARDVDFWTYAPVKQTSSQKFEKLTVSHAYDLIEDKLGNQIIHIHFDVIPPFASKMIHVQAELGMADKTNAMLLTDASMYLNEEPFIEVNHPEIKKVAIKFGSVDISSLHSMYQWTANHIQGIAYVREDRGALYALQNKTGDCTEYAYLFTAMCRANNVPSRMMGGYVVAENSKLSPEDYHNWSEFYFDGVWHVSDPQMKVFGDRPSRFVAMNIISDVSDNAMGRFQRFRFTGNNISVSMR